MAGEWETHKLGDCCDINPSSIKANWPYPSMQYIDISSVGEGIATSPPSRYLRTDAPSRAQRLVAPGDSLLSTVRPNRRSILWLGNVDDDVVVSTGFAVLRARPSVIDPRFLYYTVFDQWFTDYLVTREKGAAYPAVSTTDIADAQIALPPLAEQKRIASILGALDDKIELNRRTNATLEAMARALFQSWFVDFDPVRAKLDGRPAAALFPDSFQDSEAGHIPKGWKVGKVSDLATLNRGAVNPGDFPTETFDHFSLPAFDNGRTPKVELGGAIMSNKFTVTPNSVLLSKLNPHIPRIWLPDLHASRRSVCSTEFMVACSKPGVSREYLFSLFTSSAFASIYGTLVTGTTGSHQRIRPESVLDMKVVIPPPSLIQAFTDIAKPMFDRINRNTEQSRTLATLRDTLLPKLLSGELSVAADSVIRESRITAADGPGQSAASRTRGKTAR